MDRLWLTSELPDEAAEHSACLAPHRLPVYPVMDMCRRVSIRDDVFGIFDSTRYC